MCVCCLLFVVCRSLLVVCYSPDVDVVLLIAVRCLLVNVCRLLFLRFVVVVRCLFID